jgi:uncharacterized protein with beta-barrel porin domain
LRKKKFLKNKGSRSVAGVWAQAGGDDGKAEDGAGLVSLLFV